jgi:pSer/pThr/pTyr-binding forkhead associated (FHA) protein
MRQMQLWLTLVICGKDMVTWVLPPGTSVMIGRDESANDIVLHHPNVSRTHARIVAQSEDYAVQDVASTRGTLVNGELAEGQRRLRTGDLLTIGPFTLRVSIRGWTHGDEDDLDATLHETKQIG